MQIEKGVAVFDDLAGCEGFESKVHTSCFWNRGQCGLSSQFNFLRGQQTQLNWVHELVPFRHMHAQ
jgi:hypothetical protein